MHKLPVVLRNTLCIALGSVFAASAFAQQPDGATVYEASCAACHTDPALDSRALPLEALEQFAPETILTALTTGNMFRQGSALTDAERRML
jgi:mono/diheme cytochrome c family protein